MTNPHRTPTPSDPLTPAQTRRLACLARWCDRGRAAGAELELSAWTREKDCPAEARVLLAALLARRDRLDDARAALDHLHHHPDDRLDGAQTQLLIALLTRAGLTDAAGRLAKRLHAARGDDPAVIRWLRVMCVPGQAALPQIADASVEQLAAELMEKPEVIPTLVYAQKLEPRSASITLLRQAITRIARQFEGQRRLITACAALAELALLLGDDDDARRWAHRGLKLDPYNATLALILAKVTDDPHVGIAARDVLERVSKKQPDYPDVHAALIRRELADGHADRARLRLDQWLAREPASPIAQKIQRELAA